MGNSARRDAIEQAVAAFGAGRLQELVALMDRLEALGLGLSDVRWYLAGRRASVQQGQRRAVRLRRAYARRARACAACGRPMALYPVNSGPRDQVGGGYRSQWICPGCGEAEYNTDDVGEILRAMGLDARPPARRESAQTTPKKRCCNGTA